MRKFFILLKKEIKELLTLQVIAPMIFTVVLFFFIGNLMSSEQEKAQRPQEVLVLNQSSNNETTDLFLAVLKESNVNPTDFEGNEEEALKEAKKTNKLALLIIPTEFGQSLDQNKIEIYTIIRNFSMMSGTGYGILMSAVNVADQAVGNMTLAKMGIQDPTAIKNPIQVNGHIVVGDNQADINPEVIMGFVTQQTMFIPIILFIVIVFASQMIATAIANEKENKTLETLLTTPVNRKAIVIAKMMAAGIVSLLATGLYIFGFRSYMDGLMNQGELDAKTAEVMSHLGLTFTPESYLFLGLSLFIGILVALSISLILGAFAEDVKSVAALTSPIMILVSIPYFLTLFLDINTISPFLRNVAYAIPFSHIFLTAPNLFLGNISAVIFGILYQLLWFIIFVNIAVYIFSTDKISTMKLKFSRKK